MLGVKYPIHFTPNTSHFKRLMKQQRLLGIILDGLNRLVFTMPYLPSEGDFSKF